jgi:hypothetical protein
VECGSCHVADASGTVRYKPLETACAACHADAHAGQFASANGTTDCTRCHVTDDWQRTSFQHRPPFTTFELKGRHAQVDCASCHVTVAVAAGVKARKYRGTPSTCAACHVDVHHGAFREGVQ